MIKFFKNKKKCIESNTENKLIVNFGIKKYFITQNFESFLDIIKKSVYSNNKTNYFEFICDNVPVKLFFDIEIYKDKSYDLYQNFNQIIDLVRNIYGHEFILLESHKIDEKKSFHIIYPYIIMENVKSLKTEITSKSEFKELIDAKIIDTTVYREGLFRTIYSSKEREDRPLIYSDDSPIKDLDIQTFICNVPNEITFFVPVHNSTILLQGNNEASSEVAIKKNINIETKWNNTLLKFIKNVYKYNQCDISDIIINEKFISIALNDTFCRKIDGHHKSNHQYIIIDLTSSRQKCHDSDCNLEKWKCVKFSDFPQELQEFLFLTFNMMDSIEMTQKIENTGKELKIYVAENFNDYYANFNYDKSNQVFKSNAASHLQNYLYNKKCTGECQLEHHVSNGNIFSMKCINCGDAFPKNTVMKIDPIRYPGSSKFWVNINVQQNIINNTYISSEEDYSCDVSLDNSLFNMKEQELLLYNQILDGHKTGKISELFCKIEKNFKYCDGKWYYFNGNVWEEDHESIIIINRCEIVFSNNFERIKSFYEKKSIKTEKDTIIIKNIKSLINKLSKYGFREEIVKGAKYYYQDNNFIKLLNSHKFLIPFSNGVYDLLNNEFRDILKEDYVQLTVNYEYSKDTCVPEVFLFLEQILPDPAVREYVLKKLSECLNGEFPNTSFVMFIGDGANGKSQLLNLMKYTLGLLAEKVEVTLLTRKRNNANEANTEKAKLMNKRFAFLSEPEDGEKINISLLKELTGSEEIVARGLYEATKTFMMETKLFLACNELPEIKGEDTALWRRIKVVAFTSRFVDEPKDSNEFKIDRTLPNRIYTDVAWKQTFINILISYYYKNIPEPDSVKIGTTAYRVGNDSILDFINQNCVLEIGNKDLRIDCTSLWTSFMEWINLEDIQCKITNRQFKERIDKITKHSCRNKIKGTVYNYSVQGWIGISLTK
jgi:P4 family phage/plasmid primase-like protien